jgi:hypothetical protein
LYAVAGYHWRDDDSLCYSGYRLWDIQLALGAISLGGGVLYEGVFHSMQSRDVIGVMSIRIVIRDICRGLDIGLRGSISPGGMFILRAFSIVCSRVMSLV